MNHKILKSALCLCLLLPACNNQQEETTTSKSTEKATPAATTDTQKPAAPMIVQAQGKTISGKVLETMDAGGYTYLLVDTGKGQQWVAIPAAKIKTGDDVSYYDGMVMDKFVSKSLNRTFDTIVFSPGLVGQEAPQPGAAKADANGATGTDSFASAVNAEAPVPAMQAKTESGGSVGAMAPFTEIKVEKAAGENGYTVAELFADGTNLDGKTVRIQGKVVKYSPKIMGKNWIHLQDGSGDPLKNTHDLVVTTSAEAPKGQEIITIEGTVRANKDFGSGYSYVVLVEEAKIIQ